MDSAVDAGIRRAGATDNDATGKPGAEAVGVHLLAFL